ncbi:hypothetical protein QE152_g31061 [Popillia japonica]|uniref:Uncharacterized protein n=1 Tax=Popillia japonica TaxID=7064 RepID=A0AAW1JCX7_POPJA
MRRGNVCENICRPPRNSGDLRDILVQHPACDPKSDPKDSAACDLKSDPKDASSFASFYHTKRREYSYKTSDGDLPISPLLGVVIGAAFTVIITVMLIIIRVRKNQEQPEGALEQKVLGGSNQHTLSSTKPLLRSASPRDNNDERDPDVIPAKYGSPDGESDRQIGKVSGPQSTSLSKLPTSPSYSQTGLPTSQWVSPAAAPVMDSLYNNPVAMVGTFPRDSRPKDLRLGNGNTSSLQRTADLELNGLAIKERLMANRLPESCV